MSPVDIVLAGAVGLLTFAALVDFLVSRTRFAQVQHSIDVAQQLLTEINARPSNADLSAEFVDLHRELTKLQTVTQNQELRLSDVADSLEHRFNRIRMRQARAQQEGEEPEPEVDEETQLRLLQDLNGAPVQEEQPPQRLGRLRPRHRRDKYTRR